MSECAPVTPTLTPRELTILAALADGTPTYALERRLNIAANTIKTHKRTLYRKLGANTAAHAVGVGFRLGLLGATTDDDGE